MFTHLLEDAGHSCDENIKKIENRASCFSDIPHVQDPEPTAPLSHHGQLCLWYSLCCLRQLSQRANCQRHCQSSTGEEACCLCEHPTQGIFTLIKTRTSKVPILSSYIRSVHPFEIPEVFSLAMDQGDVHYLKWLEDSMEVDRVG
ncbi:uncharacterized protein LOC100733564 isoform X3 [Cavia porcellus]|uniref:uncharacterized protein LOC100733564 isoform X3 n=1 Tax=Cavia porcellus TaxID=10141 RepID=UPI002FE1993E